MLPGKERRHMSNPRPCASWWTCRCCAMEREMCLVADLERMWSSVLFFIWSWMKKNSFGMSTASKSCPVSVVRGLNLLTKRHIVGDNLAVSCQLRRTTAPTRCMRCSVQDFHRVCVRHLTDVADFWLCDECVENFYRPTQTYC